MNRFYFVAIVLISFISNSLATDRSEEIRAEMWSTADKNFRVLDIPSKWANESAVIIAQLNRFEYRKAAMARLLRHNEYNHYRIKLIDKNAVNKYSEMSYLPNYTNSDGESVKVYVGFKVIKKIFQFLFGYVKLITVTLSHVHLKLFLSRKTEGIDPMKS